MAERVARLDARARRLAAAFWPGPLTIVAPVADTGLVCDLARAGLDTVAVRAPAAPGRASRDRRVRPAGRRALGQPLRPPEPDHTGRRASPRPARPRRSRSMAALAASGWSSTVVSLLDGPPRLLRPGAVTRARDRGADRPARRGGSRRRPLARPARAPLRARRAAAARRRTRPRGRGLPGVRPVVRRPARLQPQPRPRDLAEAAARLFSALRAADALHPAAIAVAPIPDDGLGEAINDRLRRAAGYVG